MEEDKFNYEDTAQRLFLLYRKHLSEIPLTELVDSLLLAQELLDKLETRKQICQELHDSVRQANMLLKHQASSALLFTPNEEFLYTVVTRYINAGTQEIERREKLYESDSH